MERKEFKTKEQGVGKWQKTFLVNSILIVLGIAMSISGLMIQYHYHLRENPGESIVFALNRAEWNTIHVWTSIFFLLVTIYHVWAHRKWYKNALKQNLTAKRRPTILLTVITLLVIISGLIPFFIFYFDGNATLRFSIIEIHDKIAILFFIVVFRHTIKRFHLKMIRKGDNLK